MLQETMSSKQTNKQAPPPKKTKNQKTKERVEASSTEEVHDRGVRGVRLREQTVTLITDPTQMDTMSKKTTECDGSG